MIYPSRFKFPFLAPSCRGEGYTRRRSRARNAYTERGKIGSPEGRQNPEPLGVEALFSATIFLVRGIFVVGSAPPSQYTERLEVQ